MAVVINEFEVVPAPAEQPAAPAAGGPRAASGPTARDVERMVEHAAGRERRVRAH
jgi:hypothetical protein